MGDRRGRRHLVRLRVAAEPSDRIGIGVHILWPGDSPGFYHEESGLEGFLVLSGECIAVVEGEERRMGPWDYLHSPGGTRHITVGAGDGPCAILMYGLRSPDATILYPVEPAAAKYGALGADRDRLAEGGLQGPPADQAHALALAARLTGLLEASFRQSVDREAGPPRGGTAPMSLVESGRRASVPPSAGPRR